MRSIDWCEKRDLNPYGVNHTPLKRARLPVPPLSHTNVGYYIIKTACCQGFFIKKYDNFNF